MCCVWSNTLYLCRIAGTTAKFRLFFKVRVSRTCCLHSACRFPNHWPWCDGNDSLSCQVWYWHPHSSKGWNRQATWPAQYPVTVRRLLWCNSEQGDLFSLPQVNLWGYLALRQKKSLVQAASVGPIGPGQGFRSDLSVRSRLYPPPPRPDCP